MNKAQAKILLNDFLYGNDGGQTWIDDVWALSPFLGQGAANSAEVIAALLEICSERQLFMLMRALYDNHPDLIQALDTAAAWDKAFGGESPNGKA